MSSKERYQRGRAARLAAEVKHAMDGKTIRYQCIYRRIEQANQYKRGWNSVTAIDIDLAIKSAFKQQREQSHV